MKDQHKGLTMTVRLSERSTRILLDWKETTGQSYMELLEQMMIFADAHATKGGTKRVISSILFDGVEA